MGVPFSPHLLLVCLRGQGVPRGTARWRVDWRACPPTLSTLAADTPCCTASPVSGPGEPGEGAPARPRARPGSLPSQSCAGKESLVPAFPFSSFLVPYDRCNLGSASSTGGKPGAHSEEPGLPSHALPRGRGSCPCDRSRQQSPGVVVTEACSPRDLLGEGREPAFPTTAIRQGAARAPL